MLTALVDITVTTLHHVQRLFRSSIVHYDPTRLYKYRQRDWKSIHLARMTFGREFHYDKDKPANQPNQWNRILLEKLTTTQTVQKFSTCYATQRVHYRVQNRPTLGPILIRINTIHNFPCCFSRIHSNIIFPPTLRSAKWFLPLRFPIKLL